MDAIHKAIQFTATTFTNRGSPMNKIFHLFFVAATLVICLSASNETFAQGPGTEMTRIINRMGLGSDCAHCKALAAEMDRNGPQWVMQNRSHIAQRTISNAENLGHRMGFIRRAGVQAMIRTSVRRSR